MKVYGIILGGGGGIRMGGAIPKQFMELSGRPVIAHTLEAFSSHTGINHILVITHPDYIERTHEIIDEYSITKVIDVIAGGGERVDSSYISVKQLKCKDDDILIIHDAVRPLVTQRIIDDCITNTAEHGATVVAVRATDTVAEVDEGFVTAVPKRNRFYNFQTPQSFRYKIILDAHEQAKKDGFRDTTDDVTLVLRLGIKVKLVEGEYENIKLTTPADIKLAGSILRKRTSA